MRTIRDGRLLHRPCSRRIQRATRKSTKVSRDKVLRRETETLDAPATRCSLSHNKPQTEKVSEMFPRHVNPMQWQLAMDYASLRPHFSRRR